MLLQGDLKRSLIKWVKFTITSFFIVLSGGEMSTQLDCMKVSNNILLRVQHLYIFQRAVEVCLRMKWSMMKKMMIKCLD